MDGPSKVLLAQHQYHLKNQNLCFLHTFSNIFYWLQLHLQKHHSEDPKKNPNTIFKPTDNGHPERAFFQKFETFGLGQTNWAEILGGILAISSQTIGTILAL